MAIVRDEHDRTTFAPLSEGVGATLQHARRERGAELAQVARETRISSLFLQALEGDASIEDYPAPVYARYFLREYAQYLGLEPEPLIDAFDRQHDLEAEPAEPALVPIEPRPRRWPVVAVTLLAIAAAVTIFVTGQRPRVVEPPPTSPASLPSPSTPPSAVVPPAATEPPTLPRDVGGVRAVLLVDGDCWIRATADGELVLSETVSSRRLVFRADEELRLELGNAGAVRLEVNGEPVETGAPGSVERYLFGWRDGILVTTRL